MVLGAKRLGYGGETTRVENRGETTRGETTREETSWGRNVLLPVGLPVTANSTLTGRLFLDHFFGRCGL